MHYFQKPPPTPADDDRASTPAGRRQRYQAVLDLLECWQDDRSGYEERVWPDLVKNIEANQLSPRERFGD